MKTSIILLAFIIPGIVLAQSQRPDARYKHIKNECDQVFSPSNKHEVKRNDSTTLFISDSGEIVIENQILKYPLIYDDRKNDYIETIFNVDSVFTILFSKSFLTNENLIQAAKFDRRAISQYGDTADYTLPIKSGRIKIYSFRQTVAPAFIKASNSITFDLGLVFKSEQFSITHFFLVLNLPNSLPNKSLYQQIATATLKCIFYIGSEI